MKKFLILLVAFAGLFILSGCKDSPKEVAQKWSQAIIDRNIEDANKYSTAASGGLNALAVAFGKPKDDIHKYIDSAVEVINGDTAELKNKDELLMMLKKVDGEWKVDLPETMQRTKVERKRANCGVDDKDNAEK